MRPDIGFGGEGRNREPDRPLLAQAAHRSKIHARELGQSSAGPALDDGTRCSVPPIFRGMILRLAAGAESLFQSPREFDQSLQPAKTWAAQLVIRRLSHAGARRRGD